MKQRSLAQPLFHRVFWRTALPLVVAMFVGMLVAMPGQAVPRASHTIEAVMRAIERQPTALGRVTATRVEQPSPLTFPEQFRRDPLAGWIVLEGWGLELQTGRTSAAAALRDTLALAYGAPLRHRTAQPPGGVMHDITPTIDWPPTLPDELRAHTLTLLRSIAQAQFWRQQALAHWHSEVTAETLRTRFSGIHDAAPLAGEAPPSTQTLLNSIDQRALAQGIGLLTAAVEQTAQGLTKKLRGAKTPPSTWRFNTPWGEVVIDTTQTNNHYRGQQPLLVIDTAGNDTYAFDEERPPGVTVLLDLSGHDHYVGGGLGRDPGSATLGYAVLLDAAGNDRYEGQWLTQGAALFGAAVLIDRRGNDHYQAQGQGQGFSLGGIAALFDYEGDDHYEALTQAQASAGPGAVALLFDQRGHDRYLLSNTPLVLPSAQLKTNNASLGQGTAFGLRNKNSDDNPTAPGGLALLLDGAGNDHYEAQVFAQGAGYEGGLGVLFDADGSDHMQASWYALGAAAHHASGVFVAGGQGDDLYTVSQATSLGAAHDESVAIFVGGAGNDHYRLFTLGLGAAHDASTALFIERGGNDRYEYTDSVCRAFGASVYSTNHSATNEDTLRQSKNVALFVDLSGRDHYPPACPDPGSPLRWVNGNETTGWGLGVDAGEEFSVNKKSLRSLRSYDVLR
jgi:hypothetical protein